MLDLIKLYKEISETIRSFTSDDLQAWLDMDIKRMAELKKKNSHVNGTAVNGTARRKVTQPDSKFDTSKTRVQTVKLSYYQIIPYAPF